MNNIQPVTAYDLADASGEILIMLLVAFVLGAIFGCLVCRRNRSLSKSDALAMPGAQRAVIAQDNLKLIEGIGPKIESLLKEHGIMTWRQLSHTPIERIERILFSAGERFRMHNPKTWPEQAAIADEGRWEELEEFQQTLLGGRDS